MFDTLILFANEQPLQFAAIVAAAVLLAVGALSAVYIYCLRRLLSRFQRTFESAAVGITHTAIDGRWLRVNRRMEEITGYSRDELMRMSFKDLTIEADRARDDQTNREIMEGKVDSFVLEKRYRRKDGQVIWVKVSATLSRRDDGTPDYYIVIVEDIDELKRSEIARQENEARFRAFWDNSPFNQSVKDVHGRLIEVNRAYRETFGIADQKVSGRSDVEIHGGPWAPTIDAFDREVLQSRTTRTADIQLPGKDGDELTIRVTKFPIYDGNGHAVGIGGGSYDITGQIRSARKLREREERFRATFEQAAIGIAHLSIDGQWLRINARLCDMLGYTEEELRQLSWDQITHPDDIAEDIRVRNALIAGESDIFVRLKRYIRKDGTPLWIQLTGSMTEKIGDEEPYVIIGVQDMTEQIEAETALAARVEQQQAVTSIGQLALTQDDPETLIQRTADLVADTLGVDACLISRLVTEPAELEIVATSEKGKKYLGWVVQPKHRDTGKVFTEVSEDAVIWNNSDPQSPDLDTPILKDFGTKSAASVVIDVAGKPYGVLVVHSKTLRQFNDNDLTFLKSIVNVLAAALTQSHIASELAEREQMLDTVLDTAADGIVVADSEGQIVMANRAAEEIFGHAARVLMRKNLRELIPITYESGKSANGSGGLQLSSREMIGVRSDGTRFPIEVAMTQFDGPEGVMHTALVRDITEQKNLQSQLVQASKLATVGEMAAGIAHELNQPLNIMRMAADNVLIRQDAGTADLDYAAENLELISEQAGRMGKIILHMRVFSRQDTSDFEPFDAVQSIRSACDLIDGQLVLDNVELNVDIQAEKAMVNGIGPQLEQVLINMITNARDAILENAPKTVAADSLGRVDVLLDENADEQSVFIRVRDTGGGIPDKTLERIFDPFFTTKEVGVGTGLGLSVSYGIVNSMGGTINARNIDGGCEFCVKLPLAAPVADERETAIPQAQGLQ